MEKLNDVEDTLFVPMLGRIYAGERFPHILKDEKAMSLKERLPEKLRARTWQTEYTNLACAVRSSLMDEQIQDFLKRHPDGIIVEMGCGLETAYYRNDNGKNLWYEVDLPEVIALRRSLLPEQERDIYYEGDAFLCGWIKEIREKYPDAPVLLTASGLMYYFPEEKIIEYFRKLHEYGNIEVVFDATSPTGMFFIKGYMKKMGYEDVGLFFTVDDPQKLAEKIGEGVEAVVPGKYYGKTDKKGMNIVTKVSMWVADFFRMAFLIIVRL